MSGATVAAAAPLIVAGAFAVVTGLNDGGTLMSAGLKVRGLDLPVAVGLLGVALMVVPVVVGTYVASTFSDRMVSFTGVGRHAGVRAAVTIAILVALAITSLLAARGMPTSLTLATVGALVGAGLGLGLPVSGHTVATVLLAGVAAPLAGGVVGHAMMRILGRLPATGSLRRVHRFAFTGQCIAYAAGDGQKMFAIFALTGGATGSTAVRPWMIPVASALFVVGAIVGLARTGHTLNATLAPVRPVNAVSAELGSAGAVSGCAVLGFPVSMTQAVAGGIVGSGVGRARWPAVVRLAGAWIVTLPVSLLAAVAGVAAMRILV